MIVADILRHVPNKKSVKIWAYKSGKYTCVDFGCMPNGINVALYPANVIFVAFSDCVAIYTDFYVDPIALNLEPRYNP